METFESVFHFISAGLGVIAPLFAGAWVLINHWRKSQEKIKKLESKSHHDAIESVRKSVAEHKSLIYSAHMSTKELQKSLAATREDLIRIKTIIENLPQNYVRFQEELNGFRKETETRIRLIEGTLDDGEIVRLGDNSFMFKGRKRDRG